MSKRYYQQQEPTSPLAINVSELPTNKPVAVYYRQSTDAQVGNISTSIQTVDMVDHLKKRGWSEEDIILIDMDAGISGTTKIDERPGMSMLFDLISKGEIGAVACVDEDRLFRDITQIQVNIFIEACRAANVQVITPFMVYDFVNNYTFHARQFRFKSEMAADYIGTVIIGKLNRAKRRMMMEGRWTGYIVVPGYMVDVRKTLPDGSQNPNWRRYAPFPEYAKVVQEYFRIFIGYAGNIHKTVKHIHKHGPYYPNPVTCSPPEGFKFITRMKRYGGGYCPARNGLVNLLTNATLLGHWAVNGTVVRYNNHEPIIDEETFFQAFNYLSDTTLDGQPNRDYKPYAKQSRPSLEEERPVERPLCAGMMVSEYEGGWKTVGTVWIKERQHYVYMLQTRYPKEKIIWRRTAKFIDDTIVDLLRKKLTATFASEVWQKSVANADTTYLQERQRLHTQRKALEQFMENLLLSLGTVDNVDMIQGIQKQYEHAQSEHKRISAELVTTNAQAARIAYLEELKSRCEPTIDGWEYLSYEEKRRILYTFIDRIEATICDSDLKITICWVGGDEHTVVLPITMHNGWKTWTSDETEQLFKLFDNNATQIEIAAEFPKRTWKSIANKINSHRGLGAAWFSPRPINSYETYEMYQERVAEEPIDYKASSADKWSPEDEQQLLHMLENKATCLEILRHFQHRRWMSIVKKLRRMCGNKVEIPQDERVRGRDMYSDIVERYELVDETHTTDNAQVLSPVGRWWHVCQIAVDCGVPHDG